MTIADLLHLIKRNLTLSIIIILVCSLAGGAFGFLKAKADKSEIANLESNSNSGLFMARATLLASDDIGGIGGAAEAESDLWNQRNNDRYDEWLIAENERIQEQLEISTNTSSKKSIETAPGTWLKADFAEDFKDLTIVESQTIRDSNTVYVVAIGPDAELCKQASNEVANKTKELSNKIYNDSNDSGSPTLHLSESQEIVIDANKITIDVLPAEFTTPAYTLADDNVALITPNKTAQTQNTPKAPNTLATMIKYGFVGFVGGVVLALIVILLIDFIRRPIRNAEHIAGELDVPVLLSPSNLTDSELLCANIKLAAKDLKFLSFASIEEPAASSIIFERFQKCDCSSDFVISNAGSLTSSGSAVAKIAQSDGVILCIREWKDRIPELEDALNELSLADARLIGVVVMGDKD